MCIPLTHACASRECPQWEDEAQYYDPLHTFHDWLAEERLRESSMHPMHVCTCASS